MRLGRQQLRRILPSYAPRLASYGRDGSGSGDVRNVLSAEAVGLMDKIAHDTPADVAADDGKVLVDGPGGLSYAFTPEAADELLGD